MPAERDPRVSASMRRSLRRVAILAAVVGALLGIETLALHLTTDPFADTRLYYDAATRLNQGQPLYVASTQPGVGPYVSPPLLAIAFRPMALLPFPVAAAIWEIVLLGAFALTLRRIGLREPVLLAIAWLALPILWSLAIGQAEVLVTVGLAFATPASVAFAGYLKLLPWLAVVYWLGRRDLRSVLTLSAWIVGLGLVQLALEPAGTLAYLRLEWLQGQLDYRIISPYAIHPAPWVALVAVLALAAIRLAPTRAGWAAAVAFAVLSSPRLLTYQLMSLLAGFGGPRPVEVDVPAEISPAVSVTDRATPT